MTDYDEIFRAFVARDITPFYDKMYAGMMLYAMHILGDEFAYMAEDCVQEGVMHTYMHRTRLTTAGSWRGFMLACIRNNAIAVLRKSTLHRSYLDNSPGPEAIEDDCSYALIEHELHEMLFEAIDSLPKKYREIFDLSFEAGLKNSEAARRLGIAEITFKKRKARLLSLLHGRLGGLLDKKSIIMILSVGIGRIA